MLALVGLAGDAKKKTKGYSMGMRQRLGLAATLLGDPKVLILDEPANGLDPEGIRWLRGFFRHLAGEGRTVLVSSHQLAEVQEVADRVVILNRGKLVRAGTIERAVGRHQHRRRARPEPGAAAAGAGNRPAWPAPPSRTDRCGCTPRDLAQIGHLAFTNNVELHELTPAAIRPGAAVLQPDRGRVPAAPTLDRPVSTATVPAGPSHRVSAAGRPGLRDGGALMLNLIKSEVLKIRSTQVWFWMLLPVVALTALATLGTGR